MQSNHLLHTYLIHLVQSFRFSLYATHVIFLFTHTHTHTHISLSLPNSVSNTYCPPRPLDSTQHIQLLDCHHLLSTSTLYIRLSKRLHLILLSISSYLSYFPPYYPCFASFMHHYFIGDSPDLCRIFKKTFITRFISNQTSTIHLFISHIYSYTYLSHSCDNIIKLCNQENFFFFKFVPPLLSAMSVENAHTHTNKNIFSTVGKKKKENSMTAYLV